MIMKFTRLIALLLCAAMLLSMVGCSQTPAETTAPPTEPPTTAAPTEPPADQIYAAARAALDSADHVSSELVITTLTTVAGDEFSQRSTQTLTYQGIGTENLVIVKNEVIDYGVHSDEFDPDDENREPCNYKETWYQGTVYAELESTYRYSGPVDAEALAARYTPVVLLNSELYGDVTSETTANGTQITFAAPTAAEAWAVPEEGELVDAVGTVLVGADGAIDQMTYTVTYIYGTTEITKTVESTPLDTPVIAPAAGVANPDTYTPITYVDALLLSFTVPSLLLQADDITTASLESLFCQAAGVLRNQSSTINLSGRQEDAKVKFETGVYLMDYSSMQDQKYDLEETFENGTLTTVENDGLPSRESGYSAKDILPYAAEQMLTGMIDMDYWKDITAEDLGSVIFLEYELNENFGNTLQNSICEMLWGDATFLIALSSKYENKDLNGYLSIDKYTGLPVATGYYYEGVHTIDGQDYSLTLQFDQSIEAPSKGAYQEITDKMPEEAEPEVKPTPLFYHVTGENGQEMWLLGTIHVGDERTAYLPKEIYDAFAASDALALECDTEAFDELVEEDDELSEEVSNHYFFSDGTTIESLIEKYEAEHPDDTDETEEGEEAEDTYTQIVKLMKATGNYNMNMPYAKPYLWSSSIEQFYMRQGYQLHGDQGVEERLHDWAEELDKEIREVESNMFQLKMLTGFSNDLQLMMLGDAVNSTAREYWEDVWDLYEKWCAGDEAVLREELSDEVDMTDWTEEEIAEYEEYKHLLEEYNKAMSYDRNDGMLDVAIDYLESGDVVFYAVGLAHLLNNVNGLVDALRDAGYTVELVTYAAE